MATLPDKFEREMTITHRDFFRLLPKAVGTWPFSQSGPNISIQVGDGEINISLSAEYDRSIASFPLIRTDAAFEIKNLTDKQKSDFFAHFDRSYQRGGG